MLAAVLSVAAFLPTVRGYYHEDDIDILGGTAYVHSIPSLFHWLFLPFNEHLLPLGKFLFVPVYLLFGIDARPFMVMGLVFLVLLELGLWKLSARWFDRDTARFVLIGLFGTTAVYMDILIRPLAVGWLLSLLFSLLALLGVDWYLEGRRRAGLILAGAASFLAPMTTLFGVPAGAWSLAYAFFGGGRGMRSPGIDRLKPGFAALAGTAGYLVLYAVFARMAFQPEILGGREVFDFRPLGGLKLTVAALVTRQWGMIPAPFVGPVVSLAAFGALVAWRSRYPKRLAIGFLLWSFGNLYYVLAFRAWAGEGVATWERYQLFSTAGTAALGALAVDAYLRWKRETGRMGWFGRRHLLYAAGVIFIFSAGFTAGKVADRVETLRPIRDFCMAWSRFPGVAVAAKIPQPIAIPNETIVLPRCPPRALDRYAYFCWRGKAEPEVEWVDPAQPWPPGVRSLILDSPELKEVGRVVGPLMDRTDGMDNTDRTNASDTSDPPDTSGLSDGSAITSSSSGETGSRPR